MKLGHLIDWFETLPPHVQAWVFATAIAVAALVFMVVFRLPRDMD